MRITVQKKRGISPAWLIAGVAVAAVAAWGVTASLQRKPAPARASVTAPAEAPVPEPSPPPAAGFTNENAPPEGMRGTG